MPAWTARTVDGKAFDIADLRGSVVLINIWATWCGPCRYEIPELVKLHAEWAPQGFAVLGASIDGRATVREVEPMMRSFKINYPVVIDSDARIADLFETSVIPTSALIDRDGRVVWTRIGTLHADDEEQGRRQKAEGRSKSNGNTQRHPEPAKHGEGTQNERIVLVGGNEPGLVH
jgi:thiol-disulfide isomerase/thioredoxin